MFTTLFLFILGCKGPLSTVEQNGIAAPLAACSDYVNDLKTYQHCATKTAVSEADLTTIQNYCGHALEQESVCRHKWVRANVERYDFNSLKTVCNQHEDCVFDLLDNTPDDDVLVQIERCEQNLHHFRRDCVMHAVQRWYFQWPPDWEMERVAKASSRNPELLGMYLAGRVACDGVGSCEGHMEIEMQCERYVEEFTDRSKCPNQHRKRDSKREWVKPTDSTDASD